MSKKTQTELIRLTQQAENVYEIVFLDSSRDAVNEWMSHVSRINSEYRPQDLVRYIVITAFTSDLPIGYVFALSLKYVMDHPNRPRTRTLILYRDGVPEPQKGLLNIFAATTRIRSREKARFLSISQRAEGVTWLMVEE